MDKRKRNRDVQWNRKRMAGRREGERDRDVEERQRGKGHTGEQKENDRGGQR